MEYSPVATSLFGLVESASRTLAPEKRSMEAFLTQLQDLGVSQKAGRDYLTGLQRARQFLRQSADVPTLLSKLAQAEALDHQTTAAPATTPPSGTSIPE